MTQTSLHATVRHMDRDAFVARVLASADAPDPALPALPHSDYQSSFVGLSGRAALTQGASFYRYVAAAAERFDRPLEAGSRVLDFGVGWGRILRFFAYDVSDDGLLGCDVDPEAIAVARACRLPGTLWAIESFPPLSHVANDSIDAVYAFSVFSHLSQAASDAWIADFARVVRPGGLAVLTTRNREFVDLCASLRSRGDLEGHMKQLAALFPDLDAVRGAYDDGEFVHHPISGGATRPDSFYGETLLSRRYAERAWKPYLDVVDFEEDPFPGSYQAVLTLRKRA